MWNWKPTKITVSLVDAGKSWTNLDFSCLLFMGRNILQTYLLLWQLRTITNNMLLSVKLAMNMWIFFNLTNKSANYCVTITCLNANCTHTLMHSRASTHKHSNPSTQLAKYGETRSYRASSTHHIHLSSFKFTTQTCSIYLNFKTN